MSIEADQQSQYWSKVASKYDYVVDLQIGGKTRSLVRERLAKEKRLGTLVEFGCGTSFYTEVLSEKAESVKFQLEDCQKTSFPDGAFDTAFLSLVIHFTEPEKALAEIRRVLKTGGMLIITNLDPKALSIVNRIRCAARVVYNGLARFRVKPPKGS